MGDRRAQVAQRAVRRRHRVLRAPRSHRAALGIRSAYLLHADPDAGRDPLDWTPEHSRRARGFSTYAALRSLGRSGVAELVERTCARARALAEALAELPGCEILNDVVLNQVLFRFEDDEATDAFIAAVQDGGRGLARRDGVGRPARRSALGLELAHDRGRRRARRRGVRGGARRRGRGMKLERAQAIVDACVSAAPGPVSVFVADDHGELVAAATMDGAAPDTRLNAQRKAYTAARSDARTTRELAEAVGGNPAELASFDPFFTFFLGGVAVFDGEKRIGGVGVSGLVGEVDEQLALSAIERSAVR